MSWLFTQVWLWSLAAFVLGSVLTWWLFARPLKRKLRELSDGAAPLEDPWPEQRWEPAPVDEGDTRLDLLRRSDELDQPEDWRSSPRQRDRFDDGGFDDGRFDDPVDSRWSSEEPTFGDWERSRRWGPYQRNASDDSPLRLEEDRETGDGVRNEVWRASSAQPTTQRPTSSLTAPPEVDQTDSIPSPVEQGADIGGLGTRGVEPDRADAESATPGTANTWFQSNDLGESPEAYEWFGNGGDREDADEAHGSAEANDSASANESSRLTDVGELFQLAAEPDADDEDDAETASSTQRIPRVSESDEALPEVPTTSGSSASPDKPAPSEAPVSSEKPVSSERSAAPADEPSSTETDEDGSAPSRSLFEPAVEPGDERRDQATPDAATQHLPRVEAEPDWEPDPLPRRTPGANPRPGAQNFALVSQAPGAQSAGSQPAGDEGVIKGHFASQQYHTPESPQYDRISTEVWFRTAADAEQAGFEPWDGKRRGVNS